MLCYHGQSKNIGTATNNREPSAANNSMKLVLGTNIIIIIDNKMKR